MKKDSPGCPFSFTPFYLFKDTIHTLPCPDFMFQNFDFFLLCAADLH